MKMLNDLRSNSWKTLLWILVLLVQRGILKGQAQTINVMAYNIHHGCNIKEELQLKEIAALITRDKADIVGLVEVDSVCRRSANTDQAAILGKMTGMHTAFVRHFSFEGGAYGLALLTRFPIAGVKNMRIPVMTHENGDSTRALLLAKVYVPGMGETRIAVAHLDYRSETSRERQARFLLDLFKEYPGPVLILGDLNATPDSRCIRQLESRFTDANRSGDQTYPADAPSEKIDYILVDKKYFSQTLRDTVYPVIFSDHRSIAAETEYLYQANKRR